MRLLIGLFVLTLASPTFAQDAPQIEVFGGYSHLRADDGDDGLDLHGFHVEALGLKKAIRAKVSVVAGADYIRTAFGDEAQHNVRVSTGLILQRGGS